MTGERQAPATQHFLVSTICRGSQLNEPSGNLYIVDPERGVQSSCPVPSPPHLHRELNPRGGIRGGRGLAVDEETIYVANGAEVLHFDQSWRIITEISHPWCGNIHDIALHDGHLWVCSTANDALAQFDSGGNLLDMIDLRPAGGLTGDTSRFAKSIDYRDPAGYPLKTSNLLHVNGIGFNTHGSLLATLGRSEAEDSMCRRGLIAKAAENELPILIADDVAVPIHNVLPMASGTILTLDTGAGELLVLRSDGKVIKSLDLAPPAPRSFLRGLCWAGNSLLLVGERNRLLVVDLNMAVTTSLLTLSESPLEAVYSITPLPKGFEPLPKSLAT